jgi:hypothetical protein
VSFTTKGKGKLKEEVVPAGDQLLTADGGPCIAVPFQIAFMISIH